MSRPGLLKCVVLGLAICATTSAGAYLTRVTYHPVFLPGVDHFGNLDPHYGGPGRAKLMYDTHNRAFYVQCFPDVRNLSGQPQVYQNRLAFGLRHLLPHQIPPRAVTITADQYLVQWGPVQLHYRARAHAVVCGRIGYGDPA